MLRPPVQQVGRRPGRISTGAAGPDYRGRPSGAVLTGASTRIDAFDPPIGGTVVDLAGTSDGTSTTIGVLATYLAGSSAGTSTTTGGLRREALIGGTSAGQGSSQGQLSNTAALEGVSAGSGTTAGVLIVGMFGVSTGVGTTTGSVAVTWVLAGTSEGLSTTGYLQLPGQEAPAPDRYPGWREASLNVTIPLAGTSVGTSSMKAGETSLTGTSTGSSATGYPQLPAPGQLPSPSLYPGLTSTTLTRLINTEATSVGTSSTAGAMTVSVGLSVSSIGVSSTVGAFLAAYALTGASTGTADTSGLLSVVNITPAIALRMLEGDDGGPGLVDSDGEATMIEAGSRTMTLVGS